MCRKKYVAPASEAVGVTLATVVAGSVVPTGTTGPGNKDASETPWKENNPTTGGVGVGGGEFSGDDWYILYFPFVELKNKRHIRKDERK